MRNSGCVSTCTSGSKGRLSHVCGPKTGSSCCPSGILLLWENFPSVRMSTRREAPGPVGMSLRVTPEATGQSRGAKALSSRRTEPGLSAWRTPGEPPSCAGVSTPRSGTGGCDAPRARRVCVRGGPCTAPTAAAAAPRISEGPHLGRSPV